MQKKPRLARSRKGITLVELICTLAVMAVLGLMMGGILSSAGGEYTRAAAFSRAKRAVDTMEPYLDEELRYAENVSVTGGSAKALYAANGILCTADGSDFFAGLKGVYNGLYYTLTFVPAQNSSIELHFSVAAKQGGEVIYTDVYTMRFLNAASDGTVGTAYPKLYYSSPA